MFRNFCKYIKNQIPKSHLAKHSGKAHQIAFMCIQFALIIFRFNWLDMIKNDDAQTHLCV